MTDFLRYLTFDLQPSAFSLSPVVLLLAFLLDLAIGDPKWLPHPVRIIGSVINKTEKILRTEDSRQKTEDRLKGVFLVFIIVSSTFGLTWFIVYVIAKISSISALLLYCSIALLVYLTSTTIAVRELINSARIVIESVKNKDIESAKSNLGMIVGRDTGNLSEKGILKATIETLSENLSDGIIAPLFYLAIGGLPLAMAYKAVNTLDSMVGYKNDKYKDFGRAAARLDDIANYIPARISGTLIVIASFFVSRSLFTVHCSLKTMINDGRKHLSPNAGIPEAAIAGALGVKLGGPSTYNGIEIQKPYIGIEKTENYLTISEKAIDIIKVSSLIGTGIAVIILYIRITG
ncbi:MAG: adenosylcobinamide-phosphate synthase CbiB [Thermodesulfovibrionales bacterium]|jgi:adenosylcobinamide-phosphate synthase|nr:adenosylcobinamide-phosphate synthase CbiB [Thermodesulfovibrionales bacterium]